MVYEQRIWVALFYTSISYLRVLTLNHNHIPFLPVILSSSRSSNKQKVKIKSGISECCCLFSPVGTFMPWRESNFYLLCQNPTENPKPLRHQIKVSIDQTVDKSNHCNNNNCYLDIERRYYSINRIGTSIQGLMLPLASSRTSTEHRNVETATPI
jgi:hypothetical protein